MSCTSDKPATYVSQRQYRMILSGGLDVPSKWDWYGNLEGCHRGAPGMGLGIGGRANMSLCERDAAIKCDYWKDDSGPAAGNGGGREEE